MSDVKKTLSKSFLDNNENVNEDFASEQIVSATQKVRGIEQEREADEKLAAAKQIVKDINSAYTSAIKYERAKINFFLEKIEEIQNGEVNPSGNS
jgi:rubrerythrin